MDNTISSDDLKDIIRKFRKMYPKHVASVLAGVQPIATLPLGNDTVEVEEVNEGWAVYCPEQDKFVSYNLVNNDDGYLQRSINFVDISKFKLFTNLIEAFEQNLEDCNDGTLLIMPVRIVNLIERPVNKGSTSYFLLSAPRIIRELSRTVDFYNPYTYEQFEMEYSR